MTLESECYRLAEQMHTGAVDKKALRHECRLLAQQFQVPVSKVHHDVLSQYHQYFA